MLTKVQSLRGRSARRAFAIFLAGGLLWSVGAAAHDDPGHQIAELTREIAAEPRNAGLYLRRGELHRVNRELPAALADYSRARRLDPGLAAVDLGAGRVFLEAKRPAEAKRVLERFVRARPKDSEGRLELARAFAGLRSVDAADEQYANATALASRPSPDVYFERARFLRAAGRLPGAIHALDEGIGRLGPLASLEELAVDLELSRKNYDGALARLDRAFPPTNGRQETRLARRGEVLAAAGRSVEARESFRQAQRSIERLPPRLRQTRAIQKLEERVRKSLESLRVAGPEMEKTDANS
jgi:tetratricopeptide (TPR) repeat protein